MYTLLPVSAYLKIELWRSDGLLIAKLPVGKLHDWAGELPVPSEPVHLLSVSDRVSGIQPVCVLKLYGFPEKRKNIKYKWISICFSLDDAHLCNGLA